MGNPFYLKFKKYKIPCNNLALFYAIKRASNFCLKMKLIEAKIVLELKEEP